MILKVNYLEYYSPRPLRLVVEAAPGPLRLTESEPSPAFDSYLQLEAAREPEPDVQPDGHPYWHTGSAVCKNKIVVILPGNRNNLAVYG